VLVATAPPPLPTVRPEIDASDVVVIVVNDGEAPLTAIVPDAEGSVTVTVPATAGADRVTEPLVSPETTIELIFFPYKTTQRCPLVIVTETPELTVIGPTDIPLIPDGNV
jgi:hypothetical protein